MSDVKKLHQIKSLQSNLTTIKGHSTFGQTFSKIIKLKNLDYVVIQRPNINQMSAAVLAKLYGHNFFWIQEYHNPPKSNFFSLMLLSRADRILVKSRKEKAKLTSLGIPKSKIYYQR